MTKVHLWIKGVIVSSALLSLSVGVPISRRVDLPCKRSKMEALVRSLVTNAINQLPNPIHIPRLSEFVTLTEGTVTGLSSLNPNNTTDIRCTDDRVEISAKLYANAIVGRYRWLRSLLTRTVDGMVNVRAENFRAFIRIVQSKDGGSGVSIPVVETCAVTELEDFVYDVTGEEHITWPREKITGPAKTAYEATVKSTISDSFKDALTAQLEEMTLSVKSLS